MARVVVASEAGACFGVERALRMVRDEARAADVPVHTLGPLIHNPIVVSELAQAGVGVVEDVADAAPGDVLFLRTHGVTPQVEEAAQARGLAVRDATCPFVKRVHRAAERLVSEGYALVVAGEAGHPEVEGTRGHAPDAVVAASAAELDGATLGRKVGVVVQTTLAEETLREVVDALLGRCDELRVVNTICDATSGRQAAAAELCARADVMVVVGGRHSANTVHLAQICAQGCVRTHHIESADELDAAWFAGADLIGVTAGASTPAAHIEEVRARIEALVCGDAEADALVCGDADAGES